MDKKLDSGYYWIKLRNDTEIEIAYYAKWSEMWSMIGESGQYTTDEIFQINHNRIIINKESGECLTEKYSIPEEWKEPFKKFMAITGFEPMHLDEIKDGTMPISEAWRSNIKWFDGVNNEAQNIRIPSED